MRPTSDKLVINVDGASRGNPGLAAIGATLKNEQGILLGTLSKQIGTKTNNQAEYKALISALEEALRMKAKIVMVRSDSELLVRQMQGIYRVRNLSLRQLYEQAVKLAGLFDDFCIMSVPREQNCEADSLANRALDGKSA